MASFSTVADKFTMDIGGLDQMAGAEAADDCANRYWTSVSQGYTFTTPDLMEADLRDAAGEHQDHRQVSARRYRAAHAAELREKNRRWKAEHPEKVKEYRDRYRAAHREQVLEESG